MYYFNAIHYLLSVEMSFTDIKTNGRHDNQLKQMTDITNINLIVIKNHRKQLFCQVLIKLLQLLDVI